MSTEIQSVLINKTKFTLVGAIKWILDHGFKLLKVDTTNNFYRFRQKSPLLYDAFRTISLSVGVEAILGIKNFLH